MGHHIYDLLCQQTMALRSYEECMDEQDGVEG